MKNNAKRWRKIPKDEFHAAEEFLKSKEKLCVAACSKFRTIQKNKGHVWHINNHEGKIAALLLHSRHSLYPVFDKNPRISSPQFLSRFLGKIYIHAIQGLLKDTDILETLMQNQGYMASERIDYQLMSIDSLPAPAALKEGPSGLILRKPREGDEDQIFILQSEYEKEEVLPKNAAFNPAVTRLNLKNILSKEQVLIAELDGLIVGKINTSAESFTRFQIGGVYVSSACRSRGIATKMTAAFIQDLLSLKQGVTLFVKKRNAAAIAAYCKIGFTTLADYRITYY